MGVEQPALIDYRALSAGVRGLEVFVVVVCCGLVHKRREFQGSKNLGC